MIGMLTEQLCPICGQFSPADAQKCHRCGFAFVAVPPGQTQAFTAAQQPLHPVAAAYAGPPATEGRVSNTFAIVATSLVLFLVVLAGAGFVAYSKQLGPFAPRPIEAHGDTGGIIEKELIPKLKVGMTEEQVKFIAGPPMQDADSFEATLFKAMVGKGNDLWAYRTARFDDLMVIFSDGKVAKIITQDDIDRAQAASKPPPLLGN